MLITPHFSLEELSTTATGLENTPGPVEACCLRALCSAVLEPWRERVGPLRITSGYRSVLVNVAVGGSPTSQHLRGEAADVVPVRSTVGRAYEVLTQMMDAGLPVDQLILYSGHIHVSHTARWVARRQVIDRR